MSKNTERGIGLQGGPADAQNGGGGEAASGSTAEKTVGSAGTSRAVEPPSRQAVADHRPATLMGVPAATAEREKVTALGRDVHLPVASHRVPASRPIALEPPAPMAPPAEKRVKNDTPVASNARASDVDASRVDPGSPDARAPSPVGADSAGAAPPYKGEPRAPSSPMNRATVDASPLVVGEEISSEVTESYSPSDEPRPGFRLSIGLGVAIALLLSVVMVSVVRYASLEDGDDESYAEEQAAPKPTIAVPGAQPPGAKQPEVKQPAAQLPDLQPPGGGSPVQREASLPGEKQAATPPLEAEKASSRGGTGPDNTLGTAQEGRRGGPRAQSVVVPGRRPPRADATGETAAGGNASASKEGGPAETAPAPMAPKTAPSSPPSKASGPASNQPYDPDSPLPPAGE